MNVKIWNHCSLLGVLVEGQTKLGTPWCLKAKVATQFSSIYCTWNFHQFYLFIALLLCNVFYTIFNYSLFSMKYCVYFDIFWLFTLLSLPILLFSQLFFYFLLIFNLNLFTSSFYPFLRQPYLLNKAPLPTHDLHYLHLVHSWQEFWQCFYPKFGREPIRTPLMMKPCQ
jgi:hypothetical protein